MKNNRRIALIISLLIITVSLFAPKAGVKAEIKEKINETDKTVEVMFFYSSTCPHCSAESDFLHNYLLDKYPEISLEEREFSKPKNQEILKTKLEEHGKQKYLGVVPITFVGDRFFAGFDNKNGVGAEIEEAVKEELKGTASSSAINTDLVKLPLVGKIDPANYSMPALAAIFGILDGFNVCSLGALILILGMVLTFKDRKKIVLFGGAFLAITAIIYGLLIVLWHQMFSLLSAYMPLMQGIIAAIGLGGGVYFFKEFGQYRKYGPTCDTTGSRTVSKLSKKIKDSIYNKGASLALFGGIITFAAVLTIIEFPCSAAAPVAFAGILAEQQLPALLNIFYIVIFTLFYLLDELIIFGIAVYKMDMKATSHGKFTTWAVLVEALALTGLGLYYLWGLISNFL